MTRQTQAIFKPPRPIASSRSPIWTFALTPGLLGFSTSIPIAQTFAAVQDAKSPAETCAGTWCRWGVRAFCAARSDSKKVPSRNFARCKIQDVRTGTTSPRSGHQAAQNEQLLMIVQEQTQQKRRIVDTPRPSGHKYRSGLRHLRPPLAGSHQNRTSPTR